MLWSVFDHLILAGQGGTLEVFFNILKWSFTAREATSMASTQSRERKQASGLQVAFVVYWFRYKEIWSGLPNLCRFLLGAATIIAASCAPAKAQGL